MVDRAALNGVGRRRLGADRGIGRLALLSPLILLLAGKALTSAFGLDVAALPMDFLFAVMLVAIAGYGLLVWRLTMNAHRAQLDERF